MTTRFIRHVGLLLTFLLLGMTRSFTPCVPLQQQSHSHQPNTFLSASSIPFTIWDALPKIRTMSISDMKEELETYGESTEQLSTKKQVTRALQKARRAQASSTVSITEEEQQQDDGASDKKWSASGFFEDYEPANFHHHDNSENDVNGWKGPNIWNMHTGDMRKELEQDYGISTENLLERRQLARALEDARMHAEHGTRGARHRHHVDREDAAFWNAPPDATRPHGASYADEVDPYHEYPKPPPPHDHSPYQDVPPKNEYVNYAYAGRNGGDFYKTSSTADFLEKEDIVDAEVESLSTEDEEKSREAQEVEMHRYDPRASYMGLIIDTDISP